MESRSGAGSPAVVACFAAGLALAVAASGGLLAQRVAHGDVRVALVAQAFATAVALGVFRLHACSASSRERFVLEGAGAAAGIAIAHTVLHASPYGALPWLSERPAQFVNDGVAVFVPLVLIWATARRAPRTLVLVGILLLLTAYRATARYWHLDAGAFAVPIQDLLSRELAGSAVGLTVFRFLTG